MSGLTWKGEIVVMKQGERCFVTSITGTYEQTLALEAVVQWVDICTDRVAVLIYYVIKFCHCSTQTLGVMQKVSGPPSFSSRSRWMMPAANHSIYSLAHSIPPQQHLSFIYISQTSWFIVHSIVSPIFPTIHGIHGRTVNCRDDFNIAGFTLVIWLGVCCIMHRLNLSNWIQMSTSESNSCRYRPGE